MKRANNQGPTDAFSSGAFLCKKENSVSNAEKPLGSRVPAACTPGPGGRPAPHRSLLPPQIPPQLESRVRRVWKRTRRGPARGLGPPVPASTWRRVPALPYRGLGDVAALSDVLAVLLVGHPDPLLGDHLRGATCPKNPSDSLVRRSRTAGRLGSRRFTPPTVTGPGMPERWEHRSAGKPPTTAVRAADGGWVGGAPGARTRSKSPTTGERSRQPRTTPAGFGCQRQHWADPAPRKCRLRPLRRGRARAGRCLRPALPRSGKRGPRAARARSETGSGLAPTFSAPETPARFSELGETCRGRVRPSVNSHPGAWVSLSGIRWRRPHRC